MGKVVKHADNAKSMATGFFYRAAALQRFKRLVEFKRQLLLKTATLPLTEKPQFIMVATAFPVNQARWQQCSCSCCESGRPNLHFRAKEWVGTVASSGHPSWTSYASASS